VLVSSVDVSMVHALKSFAILGLLSVPCAAIVAPHPSLQTYMVNKTHVLLVRFGIEISLTWLSKKTMQYSPQLLVSSW